MKFPAFTHPYRRVRLAVASAVLATGLVGAAAVGAKDQPKAEVKFQVDAKPIAPGVMEPKSFKHIAERVSPAVVKITTETKAREVRGRQELGQMDPFFRQFFGDRLPQFRQPPQAGLGSGVIISPDGYVATNNHVIEDADTVLVTTSDNREFRATIVGRDPQTDIALLKIDGKDLPAITFADSSQVAVGDRVLAVGNPYGLGGTVTSGIVSATGRRAGLGLDYEDFIQTDAAINPGNSGGALVGDDGRLIGINSAILAAAGQAANAGVGFAIPVNTVV
ncbi:MAG TPA: trypsin-like peptidase domain-containing protein, partial [Candidatus Synoicihabitans sp.]|nr:trypsin-like peptidase domain-containing protein [Candidatus Synoicihabitans sp.]